MGWVWGVWGRAYSFLNIVEVVCVCVGVERAWFVAWWDGGDGCWCPAVRACVVEGQPCAERNIDLPT